MDTDSATVGVKKEHLQVEETDNSHRFDSCRFDFTEVVPLIRDADHTYAGECVSGDWFAEVKQERLAVVKQEHDDVCCVLFFVFTLSLQIR